MMAARWRRAPLVAGVAGRPRGALVATWLCCVVAHFTGTSLRQKVTSTLQIGPAGLRGAACVPLWCDRLRSCNWPRASHATLMAAVLVSRGPIDCDGQLHTLGERKTVRAVRALGGAHHLTRMQGELKRAVMSRVALAASARVLLMSPVETLPTWLRVPCAPCAECSRLAPSAAPSAVQHQVRGMKASRRKVEVIMLEVWSQRYLNCAIGRAQQPPLPAAICFMHSVLKRHGDPPCSSQQRACRTCATYDSTS